MALTVLPTTDFGLVDGDLEINVVALVNDAPTQKKVLRGNMPEEMCFGAPAVLAGDLLLFSGLHAATKNGPISAVSQSMGLPWLGIGGRSQMGFILDHAEVICQEVGTTLANLARVHLFQTDLEDFQGVFQAWQDRYSDLPLPFVLVRTPTPQPVPACTVIADMWVYAPS